jgi:hypothetical protein
MHAKLVSMAFLVPGEYMDGLYNELKKTETLLPGCEPRSTEFNSRLTAILKHALDGSARLNMPDVNARVMAIMIVPTGAKTKAALRDID